LYFIYDTRAVNALGQFVRQLPKEYTEILELDTIDHEYGKFYLKCFLLQQTIKEKTNITLTPRQIDNLLVEIANLKLNERN
jgi:hypothetical protein